jgi:class III poly(R)-hydroxyalkanoic acid synthase PhaE subunit
MTETTPSPSGSNEWIDLQRKYWDAWSQLCQQTLTSNLLPTDLPNPWAQALDNWWKAIAPGVPQENQDLIQKMMEPGKSFFGISEEFTRFLGKLSEPAKSWGNWQDLFLSRVGELKTTLSQTSTEGVTKAMRGLFPFFEMPMDTWTRTFSSASPLPGDFLQVLKPEGLADDLHDRIGRFLSVPGVGYTREWQEQAQRGARLLLDYEWALQKYTQIYSKAGIDTLERLSKKIIDRAEKGGEIKSLREIYDLWVDCCEEAYNDIVFTEEYQDAYGSLVNTLMALKHHSQNMTDELMGALNMPTHKGITTLQCRQQELRRELRDIRSRLGEHVSKAELRGMQAELNALRTDLDKLLAMQQELKTLHAELGDVKTSLDTSPVKVKGLAEPVSTIRRKAPAKTKATKPANIPGE